MDYHGIVLDKEFADPNFIKRFRTFNQRVSRLDPWTLYGIVVREQNLEENIKKIQKNLLEDKPYYAHLYRAGELIVIFKKKVFRLSPDRSTWKNAVSYGIGLGIPERQLDFAPARFEDEDVYFRDNPTG